MLVMDNSKACREVMLSKLRRRLRAHAPPLLTPTLATCTDKLGGAFAMARAYLATA